MPSKSSLTERDICTKYILPSLVKAGWDMHKQIGEEVQLKDARVYIRGKLPAATKTATDAQRLS